MSDENKNGRELQGNNSQQSKNNSTGTSKVNTENQDKEKSQPVNQNPKDQSVNRAKPEMGNSKTAGAPEIEAERSADNEEEQDTDVKAEKKDAAADKAEDSAPKKENKTDKR